MKVTLRYPLHASPDRFWEAFFDPDTTSRMHLEALGSTSVEIEELTGTPATGIERTIRYAQVPDAPGPVKRLFGSEVVTTEVGRFDPATGIWSFSLTPTTLADKTDITGTIEILDTGSTDSTDGTGTGAGDGAGAGSGGDGEPGWEQVFSLDARVKIFGAGPVVERFIEKQARDTQDRAAAFLGALLAGTG
jgi:hypothetical protein